MHMLMTYNELLSAKLSDIECIRKQPASYSRPPLSEKQLDDLRNYFNTLYQNKVQHAFAYRIYMKAA